MFYGLTLVCCLAVASAQYLPYAPHVTTQYHAQDELGQYKFGYSGGPSAKEEVRTADGVTRGSYSYVDAHGLVQTTSYVADPYNGFRVAATNLPVGPSAAPAVLAAPAVVAPGIVAAHGTPLDTPEVVAAKYAHFAAHGEALARLGRKKRAIAPLVHPLSYSTIAGAPLAHPLAYSGLVAPRYVIDRAALFDDGSYKINPLEDDGSYKINIFHDDGLYRGGRRRRSLAPLAHPLAYSTLATTPLVHPLAVPARSFAYSTVSAHPLAYSGLYSPYSYIH